MRMRVERVILVFILFKTKNHYSPFYKIYNYKILFFLNSSNSKKIGSIIWSKSEL